MYSASKICSLVKKLGQGKSKKSYNRLDAKAIQCRRGYVVMYVGEEAKRYEVPIKFLSSLTFKEVLMQSQEDDDFDAKIDGPIMIRRCTSETFEQMLKDAKHHRYFPRLEDLYVS
ncbi:Auxin responsive SAUR protein [Corchorus olitorius]|uniref:Auxin responsive SAUR protein n=1 Tax=Corchorus olitorius TaxID=93759 RepID=A0A1R3IXU6_9ROSI|nr:Auxin responsive SAUR protein [Corchorus olitorius]